MDRCGTFKLSSGRSLSRARRGTDIHGEWRPLFSFCQRAPRLSSPTARCGVWKAGVRLSGLSPVFIPTHFSLWFVGLPWRLALLPGPGKKGLACLPCCMPFPTGMCVCLARHPRGALGALQVWTPKVPVSERWRRFPLPGVLPPVCSVWLCGGVRLRIRFAVGWVLAALVFARRFRLGGRGKEESGRRGSAVPPPSVGGV